MRPVLSTTEARAADAAWVARTGLPSFLLMETAARGLAEAARRELGERHGPIVVLAGPGQNGGDGWAAARWLRSWGLPVAVRALGAPKGGDGARMLEAALRCGVPEVDGLAGAALLVDALFGTGLDRPLLGEAAALVDEAGRLGVPVVAADLPSGLDADTGAVRGAVLRATCTVTFGALKRGLFAGVGPEVAGRVEVVDLGLGLDGAGAFVLDDADVGALWPRRGWSDPKTRSGHLLVVAGSAAMAGAAVLACRGALAGGAGLVSLVAPRGAWSRLAALPPEVMVVPGGEGERWDGTLPALDRFTAGVIGPGLGGGSALDPGAHAALERLWAEDPRGWVVDADALVPGLGVPGGPRVLTPHPGEAGRLLGTDAAAVQADRFGAVRALAQGGAVALLKGHHSLVDDGRGAVAVTPTGGPALATGGSGDVLTGLIGALLARGLGARDAAAVGAWVHGAAGDRLGASQPEGVRAGQVADVIPAVVADLPRSGALLPRRAPSGA